MHKPTQYHMKKQIYTILTAVLLTVASLSAGCDGLFQHTPDPCGDADPERVEVTEILNIAHPDTVTEGDTVTFKVTIKDSLLPGFGYSWNSTVTTLHPCDSIWINTRRTSIGYCETVSNQVRFIVPQVDSSQLGRVRLIVEHDSLEKEVKYKYHNECLIGYYGSTFGHFDFHINNSI